MWFATCINFFLLCFVFVFTENIFFEMTNLWSRAVRFAESCNPLPFLRGLIAVFTLRFFLFVSVVYFAVKGFAFRALTNVELPYFKNKLGVSGDDYQKFYNITMMSFAVKPLIGAISDNLPIFGYRKRFYLVLWPVLGAAGVVVVTFLTSDSGNGPIAAALLLLALMSVAAMDLLCEGKYSELMAANPTTGSRIVTWIWACYMVGGIIAAAAGGPLADIGDTRTIFWMCLPFLALPVIPALLGWVPETRQQSSSCCLCLQRPEHLSSSDVEKPLNPEHEDATTRQRWKIVALSIATSAAAIGTIVVSLFGSDTTLIAYIAPVCTVLFTASFFILPPVAAKANLYMFLKEFLYLQINGPVDYFYTASENCVPGGPQFDFTYFQTYANIVTNVAGIVAVMLFQRFLSGSKFRSVFWFTTILKISASLVDIVLVNRWNVPAGVSDKVLYMFGDAFVYQAAMMIDFMPASVLVSRVCPEGLESTMFALLAGFSNFGQNLGRSVGYVVAGTMNIKTVVPCNFDNLYLLIAIGHMLTPLLLLPLAIVLVPDEYMQPCEDEGPAVDTGIGGNTGDGTDDRQGSNETAARRSTVATQRRSRAARGSTMSYGATSEVEVFYDLEDENEAVLRRRSHVVHALRASLALRQ